MQHVYIIGSKGVPANYGGYETFVDKLIENQQSIQIQYHIACAVEKQDLVRNYMYNGADCFQIAWRPLGAARAITYDIDALRWCISHIEANCIKHPIVYILACRIGPFIGRYALKIHELGGVVLVNPDGHEWLRAKWSAPIRKYWKISERGMVRHADLLVCDSLNIQDYINGEYSRFHPNTVYIAYGADIVPSNLTDNDSSFTDWLLVNGLETQSYYLVVGRFVPENNYETMIREFMLTNTERSLVLITNVNDSFLEELQRRTGFRKDSRIKFVGTVYDKELLKKIRESAYAYLHGHQVGGTNPSLLEALASTQLNLLLDVGFNQEVAGDSAFYWTKKEGSLASLLNAVDHLDEQDIALFGTLSKKVISERYSWSYITNEYETLFLNIRDVSE